MKVPFLDLKRQYDGIKEEVDAAIRSVLDSQKFILGQEVEEFEDRMTRYCNAKHAIGVASGTDALLISLRACGIRGRVLTSPFTFFATAGAIHNAGAVPSFSDIDPETYNIDTGKLDINKNTKAMIPVHLFGQAADMEPITEMAEKHGLAVIEDAAQAMGEEYRGRRIGSSSICCFSFFPSKNLGGYGDGGLITTNDGDMAEKMRALRTHGAREKYYHHDIGYNSRLDAIQAAVLNVKLNHLEEWTKKRMDNAKFYGRRLGGVDGLEIPRIAEGRRHVFNQYTIRITGGRRDELMDFLKERGIGTAIYYPLPLHLQPCFSSLGYREGDFPEAERASGEVLSLPIYPELRNEEREYVASSILEFYGDRR